MVAFVDILPTKTTINIDQTTVELELRYKRSLKNIGKSNLGLLKEMIK